MADLKKHLVCGEERRSIGVNITYAPVCDAAENIVGDYILESFSDLLKLLPGVKL